MTYFDRYEMLNGITYVYKHNPNSKKEVQYELCEEIKVVQRRRLMYEKNHPIMVDVFLNTEPDAKPLTDIPRSVIVKNPIDYFSDYGLTISNVNEYNVTLGEILQDTEKAVPIKEEHNKLGFIIKDKKPYFAASSIYPTNKSLCLKNGIATKSRGTFESWREALLPYIEENANLQLALAISASAPVVRLLQYYNVMHETPMFAYIGASSTGKTVAMSLGATVFGRATTGDGIIDTMIDTENYFFSQLSKKNGFPHFIDEATLYTRMDFTNRIYQVSMQHERGRLNGDGTPKATRKWVSTVIFTGERSMLGMTNGNAGLYARIIEFNCAWTKDGDSADEIYKIINDNYGTAWIPLIQGLRELKKTELIEVYNNFLNKLKSHVTTRSGVGNRILSKFAVLLSTAAILQEVWDMTFDIDAITNMLIDKYYEIVKGDVILEAYEKLLAHIVENGNLFPPCSDATNSQVCCDRKHGILTEYKYQKCVWMLKDKFEEFIAGLPNVNLPMIRKEFKERGYIGYFDESYLRKQKIGSAEVSCYCVFLDYGSSITSVKKEKKRVKKKVKKSSVLAKSKLETLLTEDAE